MTVLAELSSKPKVGLYPGLDRAEYEAERRERFDAL
jgi:hypothetical protein